MIFSIIVSLWTAELLHLPDFDIETLLNEEKGYSFILLLIILAIITIWSIFWNDFISQVLRLTFLAIGAFSFLIFMLFVFLIDSEEDESFFHFVSNVCLTVIFLWYWPYFKTQLFLVLPISRWKKYKIMNQWSLQASKKRTKVKDIHFIKPDKMRVNSRRDLMLILGIPLSITGLFVWISTFFLTIDGMRLVEKDVDVSDINIGIWRNSYFYLVSLFDDWRGWVLLFVGLFLGFFCFWLLGYLWDRYRRAKLTGTVRPITELMTASDMLYLRSFRKENKFLRLRKTLSLRLIFSAYDWSFTFEELIAKKLAYIGLLFGLGANDGRNLEGLQTPGGIRYYLDAWEEEAKQAMDIAKIIVLMMGDTPSLSREIGWIKEKGFLDKTLFLMPPNSFGKRRKLVINQMISDVLNGDSSYFGKGRVNPKRILALIFHNQIPYFINGKQSTGGDYAAALEVASGFILATPDEKQKVL